MFVTDAPSTSLGPAARVFDLLAERERIDAELLGAIGSCLETRAWEADGSGSPVAWLAHRGSLLRRDAASLIRSARLVRGHERIRTALARGTVRTRHVQELGRVARHREELFADHVDTLIDAAESVDPERFLTVARRWAAYADDHENDHRVPADHAPRRWLDVAVTFAGSVRVDGLLDPEGGATFLAALGQHEEPPNAGDTRSAGTRRADALIQLVQGTNRSVNLDVVVDVATLAGIPTGDLTSARHDLDPIGPIRPNVVRRLACDAAIGRVVMHGPSEILDLGRRTRLVSPALRRALVLRDRGCVVEGCHRPHQWCDAHHIIHWADGGLTIITNLVLICRHHHTQLHEQRGQLVRSENNAGKYVVAPP